MRWLDSNTNARNMNLGKVQETVKDREAWHAEVHRVARVRHDWMTEQLFFGAEVHIHILYTNKK